MKVKLDEGVRMPKRAHDTDAGLDLFAPEDFDVPGCYCNDDFGIASVGCQLVDTGVHIELPPDTVGMVKSKSGLNVKYGLTCEGVVDEGYTGSIRVKFYNHTSTRYRFKKGDKMAQLVILPIVKPELTQVEVLDDTERGEGGFGSTGR